jgi:hypothetical protein
MDIAFALRRKRDEIATMISVYEDRIGAAKREMAALQQSARLFDPEGGGEDTVLHRELEGVRGQEKRPPAQHEVWESKTETAIGQLTLPVSGARDFDDRHVELIGVQKPQFTGGVAHLATHRTGEQIPAEFFYFNWP